jgi:hypothetical protein
MSAIASFHVLSKQDFTELRKLAKALPQKRRLRKGERYYAAEVGPSSTKPQRKLDPYIAFYEYLDAHAKEPYEFNQWSGYAVVWVLMYLKEVGIDLQKSIFVDPEGLMTPYFLFNEQLKDKYFDRLNPSHFSNADLKEWMDKDSYLQGMPTKPMKDGIRFIYKYFKLVDKETVVLLHIG